MKVKLVRKEDQEQITITTPEETFHLIINGNGSIKIMTDKGYLVVKP